MRQDTGTLLACRPREFCECIAFSIPRLDAHASFTDLTAFTYSHRYNVIENWRARYR